MAELAYAADLKSAAFGLVGSSPTASTSINVLFFIISLLYLRNLPIRAQLIELSLFLSIY